MARRWSQDEMMNYLITTITVLSISLTSQLNSQVSLLGIFSQTRTALPLPPPYTQSLDITYILKSPINLPEQVTPQQVSRQPIPCPPPSSALPSSPAASQPS